MDTTKDKFITVKVPFHEGIFRLVVDSNCIAKLLLLLLLDLLLVYLKHPHHKHVLGYLANSKLYGHIVCCQLVRGTAIGQIFQCSTPKNFIDVVCSSSTHR